ETGFDSLDRIVVRHIGGHGDLGKRYGPVSARNCELAILELNIGLGCLKQVSSDLLALVHYLVHRLYERRAAHCEGARGVGAHAKRDLARVAMHDVDQINGYAELLCHHLCKSGFVALAMAVRAGKYCDAPSGVNANLCRLIKPSPCAELTGDD